MTEKKPNKHDKCVICGELTEYAEMDHVPARNFYVEGAGQLCQACFDQIYHYEKNTAESLDSLVDNIMLEGFKKA